MSFQRVSAVLWVTIPCMLSCALLPVSAAEQAEREVAKGTLMAPSATLDPPVPVKRCTVVDSNGPLEGGKITTYGCSEDEVCICEYHAGYSCGGSCRPLRKDRE